MRRTVDGLVLREMPSGDNDRRILVLTSEEGKMWIVAKGAKSVRSKYAAISHIFSYANFEFYEKNNTKWLSGGSSISVFSNLQNDLEGFSLASYIAQIADEITGEDLPAETVLRTTLNAIYAIDKKLKPYEQIKAAYELFAASESGFMPDVSECSVCKSTSFSDTVWLDVMNGSIVCDECLKKQSGGLPIPETDAYETKNILLPLDASVLEAMRYVTCATPQRLLAFSLRDERSLSLFSKAAESFLLNHLERDFSTLHFYEMMKDKK